MTRLFYPNRMIFLAIILATVLAAGLLAAYEGLAPKMSYQGRLTNAQGQPLNGEYTFMFSLFTVPINGTGIYTDTKKVLVTNGLFDTSIGPSTILENLPPRLLAQPLWLEVVVNSEVLTPRQQLLGAPYAFTLMPGSVITYTLSTALAGASTDAVLTVVNSEESDPLPTLRVQGLGGLEIFGKSEGDSTSDAGAIYSKRSSTHSDLRIASNDELYLDMDTDNNSTSSLRVRNGSKQEICTINESGNLHCIGNLIMDGIKSSVVSVENKPHKMYAVESPEVWFEDFGSGALVNGVGRVAIDPLFAATVNLNSYRVFVTPLGDCQGLYVSHKTPSGFEVHELGGGAANIPFDYRLVAKRVGYESDRLEPLEAKAKEEK